MSAAVLLALSALQVFGQALGNVVGTVTDSGGGVVPDAKITVTNAGTHFTRSLVTNASGGYVADSFPAGQISVTAEKPGFEKLVRSGVTLSAADTVTINLQLAVGNTQQTMQVNAEASQVQSQSATVSSLVNNKQIEEMPYVERTFTNMLALNAGVVPSTPGQTAGLTGYTMNAAIAYTVNGAASNGNAYLIDGLYDRQLWTDYIIMQPPIEAIQETRVMGSNYTAQYGNSAGAVTLVLTKSGTNEIHGSLYEYLRNSVTDANTFFSNLAGKKKAAYHRNEFGGIFGAPIRKNKTFIFADYQGERIVQPTTETDTIPSQAQVQMIETGNFSSVSTILYNPYTTNAAGQRIPFAGNIIPAALLDPAAGKMAALLPLPTSSASANNLIYNPEGSKNDNQYDIRGDQNIGTSDRLFFKFSHDGALGNGACVLPTGPNVPAGVSISPCIQSGGGGGIATIGNWSITGNYTKVVSANILNEVHFGAVRDDLNISNYGGTLNTATSLGVPGINVQNYKLGVPAVSVSGFTAFGDTNTYPEFTHQLSLPVEDMLTVVKGNHTMNFGGGYTRHRLDGHTSLAPRGQYAFQGVFTEQIGGSAAVANDLADFAIGAPVSIANSEQFGPFGERMWDGAMYAQDTWRVTRRLTVTYGLRWDLQSFPYDVWNRWSNINPTNGVFAIAGTPTQNVNGNCGRSLVCLDKKDFSPRLGIAHQLTGDGKTVFRAGFGEAYWRTDNAGRTLNLNPPMDIIADYSYPTNGPPGLLFSQGVPLLTQPNLTIPSQETGLYEGSPTGLKNTRVLMMSAGIQRELGHNWLLDVGYVRTLTSHELDAIVANQAVPGPGAYGPRRPLYNINPYIQDIDYRTDAAAAKYNALQTKLTKRYSYGLTSSINVTWQKNMNDDTRPQNSQCYACEWGDTADSRVFLFVVTEVYELPFGKGRKWSSKNAIVNNVIGDWSVDSIWTVYSGPRFTPSLATSVTNSLPPGVTGTIAPTERPNVVAGCNPNDVAAGKTIYAWFNTKCFTAPPAYTFGDGGNGILIGPGFVNVDLGFHRTFNIRELARLTFRWEMFNAANHTNFSNPGAAIGSSSAGVISAANAARVMQGALTLRF
jgi:hypothetical protein